MSLDQRYIQEYCRDAIHTKNGKYKVTCPVCIDIATNKGKLKPNKKSAVLIPLEKCKSKYVLYCSWCKDEGRGSGMDLLPYLYLTNTEVAEKYKAEKNGYAELIKGFNSKPKWSKS